MIYSVTLQPQYTRIHRYYKMIVEKYIKNILKISQFNHYPRRDPNIRFPNTFSAQNKKMLQLREQKLIGKRSRFSYLLTLILHGSC